MKRNPIYFASIAAYDMYELQLLTEWKFIRMIHTEMMKHEYYKKHPTIHEINVDHYQIENTKNAYVYIYSGEYCFSFYWSDDKLLLPNFRMSMNGKMRNSDIREFNKLLGWRLKPYD